MEVYQVRPTRSGRQPKKPKKLRARHINTLDSNVENESLENDETIVTFQETNESQEITNDLCSPPKNSENTAASENITTVIPDINQIEPGSFVILTKESAEEPGKTILQVYMVSSNVDKKDSNKATDKPNVTPVDLPPELLSTVTTKIEDVERVNIVDDCE